MKDIALRGPLFFRIDKDFRIRSAFSQVTQYSVLTEKYLTQTLNL
jgi:hypothetical protein